MSLNACPVAVRIKADRGYCTSLLDVLGPFQPDRFRSNVGQGNTFGPVRAWHISQNAGFITVPGLVLAHFKCPLWSRKSYSCRGMKRNAATKLWTSDPRATGCFLSSCLLLFFVSNNPQSSEADFNQPDGSVGVMERKSSQVWDSPLFPQTGVSFKAIVLQTSLRLVGQWSPIIFPCYVQFVLTVWEGSSGNASACSLCYRGTFVFCHASKNWSLSLCSCGFSGQCCSRFFLNPGCI